MKTLRFAAMALIAATVSGSATSCDDDERADDANIDYRLYYSGKSCKGYAPFLAQNMFIQTTLALAHPELFGLLTGLLPDSVCYHTYYTQRGVTYYSYTLDDDGYLASATEYDGRDDPHPVTRYYTWE